MWRSLVARLLGVQKVAGSNPVTLTTLSTSLQKISNMRFVTRLQRQTRAKAELIFCREVERVVVQDDVVFEQRM